MKTKVLVFVTFIVWFQICKGQGIDSLNTKDLMSSEELVSETQSPYYDSLFKLSKLDSMQMEANQRLDSGIVALNTMIDSLNTFVRHPDQYQVLLNGLYEKFGSTFLAPLKLHGDSINNELKQRVGKLQNVIEEKKEVLDSLLSQNQLGSIPQLKLNTKLPNLSLPSFSTDQWGVSSLNSLPADDFHFTNPTQIKNIGDLTNSVENVGDMTQGIMQYSNGINEIRLDDFGGIDNIEERFEEQLMELKEIKEFSNGSASLSKVQKEAEALTEKLKDKETLKEEVETRSKKQFVDYFAGHEDKIDSEMKSMEKLQRKYHSVTDVRYLPKRRTNPEKEKPFVERLIIGTTFQIDRRDPKWTGMDVSPYFGYKFSDRFRLSAGGTYRVTFDTKTFEFAQENKVYGFRTFGNYRIFGGWFGHLEAEALRMKVPTGYTGFSSRNTSEDSQWIPLAYVGIFKTFTLGKHFQGQTQVLYDFLDGDDASNFNKFTLRFGVEYKILKKKK